MTPFRSALIAAAALGVGAQGAQAFTLHILHFNDFHSRVESINGYDATCSAEEETARKCFGGSARLVAAIKTERDRLRAAGETVIVLSAGDAFQGSLFFSTLSGNAEREVFDRIGMDAVVVGNHEFDLGPGPLAAFASEGAFPLLFGNTDTSGDPGLAALVDEPLILEMGGERVAVVGAVTADAAEISTPGPTIAFDDPAAYLAETVAALTAEGVTKVIALTHLGVDADIAVARSVPGIDAIVGGHTHTLFSNTDPDAPYRYPHGVAGPDGRSVPIVQAGANSKYLGHLRLTFDAAGVVTEAVGDTMLLDAAVPQDPEMLARIEDLRAPIEALKASVVAQTNVDIDGGRDTCRAGECAMGNLVAEAMLARVAGQGVQIAIQNGGGLRASIAAGEISKGDVLAVLPFQNTLATFNLTGAGVVAALENGVSQVEEGGGRFPQIAGLTFVWDRSVPPMQGRIRRVTVREGDGFVPIDPKAVYAVVTNNFMRGGGDGYDVFRDGGTNAYDFGPNLEDVVADYLVANPDYEPVLDGRIAEAD